MTKPKLRENIRTECTIHVISDLFVHLVPATAAVVVRWCLSQGRRGFTSIMCHRATQLLWRDCVIIMQKLVKLGILSIRYQATTFSGLCIYNLEPFVCVSKSPFSKKRKRHFPKVSSANVFKGWMADATDIKIYQVT